MTYGSFFLPFIGLLLVIFQTSLLSGLFMGRLNIEVSLVLVIYAGFRMNVSQGAFLSFLLGFFLDCALGSMSGMFTLIYVCVFFLSVLVSMRVYAEQTLPIMVFSFLCCIFEGLMMVFFFKMIYDINMLESAFRVFLPQALAVGALSPLLFKLFRYFETLHHGRNQEPAK